MNRLPLRLTLLSASAIAVWLAAACTISDREIEEDPDNVPDGGGEGGSGNGGGSGDGGSTGGKASGGGTSTGGKSSGGGSATGGRTGTGGQANGGSGGKATGGTSATGGAGTGGSNPARDYADAILAYATASCNAADRCAPFGLEHAFGDVQTCVDRYSDLSIWAAFLEGSTYTPEGFRKCAAAWDKVACDDFFDPAILPDCDYPGTLANGAACNSGNQCQTGYCKQTGYQCGVCAAPLKADADCTGGEACANGLVCSNGRCQAPPKAGADCDDLTKVECQAPWTCYSGKCVRAPATVGAACDPGHGLFCDANIGLYCNAGKCAQGRFLSDGQACNPSAGLFCGNHGDCVYDVCLDGAVDDAPCNDTVGPSCQFPAICDSGFCTLPDDTPACSN